MNGAGTARAFAPASVGNISVGFDLLGHAIEGPRDEARVRRRNSPGVVIREITGCVPDLPLDPERNSAGRALMALCRAVDPDIGFELWLHKGIPLGSGLGGSAASAVAALVAANQLLPEPLPRDALYPFALEGEAAATGARHGDNIAPMLLGGIALATDTRLLGLPVPDWLWAAVVHPRQVLETRHSRAVLNERYALAQVVKQTGHLALFLSGLARGDRELIRAGLKDVLVEPLRASLIPGFEVVRAAALDGAALDGAALDSPALGAGISGGGPSVFAWFDSRQAAVQGGDAMRGAFSRQGITADIHVSPVAAPRAEVL